MPTEPPFLPPTAPKDLVDFVACKTNTVTLKGGPQAWVSKIDLGVTEITPDVTFEKGDAPGSVNAVVGKGGIGVTMPVSVVGGNLTVDTSSLPGSLQTETDAWIKQFNEHLKAEGKQVGGITLKGGSITITKVAVPAAGAGTVKKVVVGGGVAVVVTAAVVGGLIARGNSPGTSGAPAPGTTAAATTATSPTPVGALPARTWQMNPIVADFNGGIFATGYTVEVHGAPAGAPTVTRWSTSWSIQLALVDAPGAADPAEPGSKAAVDIGCNNAGRGIPNPEVATLRYDAGGVPVYTGIRWTHPSPPDSAPPGVYHCEHLDQGPHGHQGLITVTVSDANWTCVAKYKGTHTGNGNDAGQPGPPVCTRTAAPSPTP